MTPRDPYETSSSDPVLLWALIAVCIGCMIFGLVGLASSL